MTWMLRGGSRVHGRIVCNTWGRDRQEIFDVFQSQINQGAHYINSMLSMWEHTMRHYMKVYWGGRICLCVSHLPPRQPLSSRRGKFCFFTKSRRPSFLCRPTKKKRGIWISTNTPQIRRVKLGDYTGLTDALWCLIHGGGTCPNFGMDAGTRVKNGTHKNNKIWNQVSKRSKSYESKGRKRPKSYKDWD